MSEAKHTPGPWSWTEHYADQHDGQYFDLEAADDYILGGVRPKEADRSLIAAAPDMLEALQRIAEQVHNEHADLDDIALMATRAIEKAEGRSVVPHERAEDG